MHSTRWRAAEIAIPNGCIAVDVADSGRFAQQTVSVSQKGTRRILSSLRELGDALQESLASPEQLASSSPVAFAYLLCVLSGRPHHVFPRDNMWPELEQHFGLSRSGCQPRVEQGKFVFLVYSQYMPTLTVSRITVDLSTLLLTEEVIVSASWPPSPGKAAQSSG